MGAGNKLLLEIDGKSILRFSTENLLKSKVNEIVVVTGTDRAAVEAELQSFDVRVCYNKNYKKGISSSIRSGLQNIQKETDAALILLADQPNLGAEIINQFIEKFQQNQKIVAGRYKETICNPVLFPRIFFEELKTLKADFGAKSILQKHADKLVTVDIPENNIVDLDTPTDFKRIETILKNDIST